MKKNEDPTLLAGIKPVLEFLHSNPQRVDTLFMRKGLRHQEADLLLDLCRVHGIRYSLVDNVALDRMCSAQHQGVIARLGASAQTKLPELLQNALQAPLPLLVALDQVQDPGNVGTLARTMHALGCAGLILPKHNSAYLGDGARKAAAGAFEHLPLSQVTNLGHALDEAEEAGFSIIGTGIRAQEESLNAFTHPMPLPAVLVLGNEGKGMRPGVAKRCGQMVHIPMQNHFNSLNVAQAGAIIIGLVAQQVMRGVSS